uniref:Uncharacterized protein n=1 Tax=Branchiostoma floridae TaxID=7739 RepID=C3ZQB6_BRAFL|eukprot:XP_002589161.1 hypothetical protein BRAFLDRAFT_84945 [Branchiostoma floridae]
MPRTPPCAVWYSSDPDGNNKPNSAVNMTFPASCRRLPRTSDWLRRRRTVHATITDVVPKSSEVAWNSQPEARLINLSRFYPGINKTATLAPMNTKWLLSPQLSQALGKFVKEAGWQSYALFISPPEGARGAILSRRLLGPRVSPVSSIFLGQSNRQENDGGGVEIDEVPSDMWGAWPGLAGPRLLGSSSTPTH